MAEDPRTLEIADGLYVTFHPIAALKEQDVNAQVMQPREMARLAENIRGRGQLESLPYCYQNGDEPVQIVSGHHRVRAAREAGLQEVPILLDRKHMTRSELVAKQIAHNQLHGEPDEAILRQLVTMIEGVDDLLATGLPDEYLPLVDDDDTNLGVPHAEFDWRTVTLMFLPKQMKEFGDAVEVIESQCDMVGVADREQFKAFARAVHEYGRFANVKSLATSIAQITQTALSEIQEMKADDVKPSSDWQRTRELVGGTMPPDAAKVVRQAVEKLSSEMELPDDQKWRALEYLAAEYLAGA